MKITPKTRVLAMAAALGIITAGLVYSYLANQARAAKAPIQAVIATRSIAGGAILDGSMLEVRGIRGDQSPRGVIGNPEALIGMVAKRQIRAGEVLTSDCIVPKYRMSQRIPPLMRAVTVALDPIIGVGGFIKPGDHVDVIATFDVNKGTITKTVLQDVELLATGSEIIAEEIDPQTGRQTKATPQPNATLAVMPMDAERLILAESKGKLRLALRRSDDMSFVTTRGVTGRAVMGNVPSDAPEKREPTTVTREVGANRAVTSPVQTPLAWQVGPITPQPGEQAATSGKTVEIVRGTKVEEAVVPD
jgi:pilus assembly protein CpaB